MDKTFWLQRWQQQKIGFHQNEITPLLKSQLSRFSSDQTKTVLVPLCGKSRDLSFIASFGHEVIGVELSSIAVKAFFQEQDITPTQWNQPGFSLFQHENITIMCGDIFSEHFVINRNIDVIYDRAALIALPLPMRMQYANVLTNISAVNTEILQITLEYDSPSPSSPPFSINHAHLCELYQSNWSVSLLEKTDHIRKGIPASDHSYLLKRKP